MRGLGSEIYFVLRASPRCSEGGHFLISFAPAALFGHVKDMQAMG